MRRPGSFVGVTVAKDGDPARCPSHAGYSLRDDVAGNED